MNQPLHNELKKEFQLERMILFSDAVFAIAITLLAIEIKVPELHDHLITEEKLLHSLGSMVPKFIGFLISFFIIGQYWTVHHRLFGFVVNFNLRLLWMNLFFLLAVVLMPFSTAFYSEYIVYYLKTPFILYIGNILFLGITNFLMWRYVGNPRFGFSEGMHKTVVNYFSFRAILVPIIFIFMAFFYFSIPRVGIWVPALIPVVLWLVGRMYRKKLNSIKK